MNGEAKTTQKPFRAGVFSSLAEAEQAVQLLLDAGFSKQELSVICSDESLQKHFKDLEPPHPTPNDAANTAIAGGAVGGVLGGLASAGLTTAAGLSLLVIAPGLLGGAIAGSLIGMMSTRGGEKEVVDFYNRAVSDGKLLVAIEYHGDQPDEMLPRAEQALEKAGAESIPLVEG